MTDNILLMLAVCSSVYFFAEANYICGLEDYRTWVVADIASQFARPLVPPLMVLCLHSMMGRVVWRWWMTLAFALSVVIGSVSMSIYLIMGMDNAVEYVDKSYDFDDGVPSGFKDRIYMLYQFFCVWLYRATIVVYSMIGIGRIVWLFYKTKFRVREIPNFLFRGGELEPAHLMGILYVVCLCSIFLKLWLSRYFFLDNRCFAGLFCVSRGLLVFLIGHVGLRNERASVSFGELWRKEFEGRDSISSVGTLEDRRQGMFGAEADALGTGAVDGMELDLSVVERERMFLDPRLSVEMVASKVGSNRTYVARYLGEKYGCTFREYVGRLRIEYAKEYMMKHRDAKQEVIAEECGFVDAPSFNKKFKQIEGKSPRMWLMMRG